MAELGGHVDRNDADKGVVLGTQVPLPSHSLDVVGEAGRLDGRF